MQLDYLLLPGGIGHSDQWSFQVWIVVGPFFIEMTPYAVDRLIGALTSRCVCVCVVHGLCATHVNLSFGDFLGPNADTSAIGSRERCWNRGLGRSILLKENISRKPPEKLRT